MGLKVPFGRIWDARYKMGLVGTAYLGAFEVARPAHPILSSITLFENKLNDFI